jgi:glycosyltransferase involved in cell wall biosynthesis
MNGYTAITPVRDEERFLPGLIESMTAQTIRPRSWIVIDDGSTDATGRIIEQAAAIYDWIVPHHLDSRGARAAGGESVIMRFLPRSAWRNQDFIFRVDGDISFEPGLMESLMHEFERDKRLGIASATLMEPSNNGWREVPTPSFHTRGATKLYSAVCFEAIGGLKSGLGWDTIDEAHAMMLGFTTRSFAHVRAYHHRPQGGGVGLLRGRLATGRSAYQIGYSPMFMMARAARRSLKEPYVLGSLLLLAGYFEGYLRRQPRLAPPEVVKFVRAQQRRRLMLAKSLWR